MTYQRGPASPWTTVQKVPMRLRDGDRLKTGTAAKLEIVFDEGARIELGPKADFTLGQVGDGSTTIDQKLGTLKAWVDKAKSREFKVRTPSAVAAVRGTEFTVQVSADGRTAIELYRGLLGISDNAGNELLLREGQRLEADPARMGAPQSISDNRETRSQESREQFRNEVRLDATKEEVLAAAEKELKLAEYQQGKALIDVHGDRVRLEQYILRPQPDQFKLVVLNERANRFDYFFYQGTFNKTLPTDLSLALRQLPGCVGNPCEYHLTAFGTGRSNLTDNLAEIGIGGHQVDVNNNTDLTDNVAEIFDPALNSYVTTVGQSVYQTMFDKYALYANGQIKEGWTGVNIQNPGDRNTAPNVDPITGVALGSSLIPPTITNSFGDPEQIHQDVTATYNDDTFIRYDNFIIDDEGQIALASDFASVTDRVTFRATLLNWNYQQVITASEFQGRSIDLVVAPKILIQSGLIQ